MHIPLKQGLRLLDGSPILIDCQRQNAYSTKTRIKTISWGIIKKIIETVRMHIPLKQGLRPNIPIRQQAKAVRMHIPLKQGLRRKLFGVAVYPLCQNAYSTKTRIKTLRCFAYSNAAALCQNAYSTKTRIKTSAAIPKRSTSSIVRMHIPLKQGLRLCQEWVDSGLLPGQNAYSTKTRIKTNDITIIIICVF